MWTPQKSLFMKHDFFSTNDRKTQDVFNVFVWFFLDCSKHYFLFLNTYTQISHTLVFNFAIYCIDDTLV